MKLLEYNNKYLKVIDIDDIEYIGMGYYEDADTAEEPEDTLTIAHKKNGYTQYLELLESDIKSIEVLE